MSGMSGISNSSNFSVTNQMATGDCQAPKQNASLSGADTAQAADGQGKASGADLWKALGDMLFPKKEAAQRSPVEQFMDKLMDKISQSFMGKMFGSQDSGSAASQPQAGEEKSGGFMDKLMDKLSQGIMGKLFGG